MWKSSNESISLFLCVLVIALSYVGDKTKNLSILLSLQHRDTLLQEIKKQQSREDICATVVKSSIVKNE